MLEPISVDYLPTYRYKELHDFKIDTISMYVFSTIIVTKGNYYRKLVFVSVLGVVQGYMCLIGQNSL